MPIMLCDIFLFLRNFSNGSAAVFGLWLGLLGDDAVTILHHTTVSHLIGQTCLEKVLAKLVGTHGQE